jgi:hypothetical protein
MGWTEHVIHMEEKMIAYRILVGKPEGTKPLGRCRLCCRIMINGT